MINSVSWQRLLGLTALSLTWMIALAGSPIGVFDNAALAQYGGGNNDNSQGGPDGKSKKIILDKPINSRKYDELSKNIGPDEDRIRIKIGDLDVPFARLHKLIGVYDKKIALRLLRLLVSVPRRGTDLTERQLRILLDEYQKDIAKIVRRLKSALKIAERTKSTTQVKILKSMISTVQSVGTLIVSEFTQRIFEVRFKEGR